MTNNDFSPNSISHKELNNLLNRALKENSSIDASRDNEINQNQEFNDLISNWAETSQKILFMLNNKEGIATKNRKPKSLMALGAMGAHINMALQAMKATKIEEE